MTSAKRWAGRPTWTADGRHVVFSLAGEFSLEKELWRVPASGSEAAQRLRFAGEQGDSVAISRGGTRLAYRRISSDRNIYRVDLRHQPEAPVNLISSTRDDIVPQFSPDGRKIVFISARSGAAEVWACSSDGSGAVQLTFLRAQNTGCPRWSPDGKRIVFCSNAEGQWENYVMDAGGGAPKRLTNDPADDAVPSWSRDGRWIYFVSNRSTRWQVWKMPADGGQPLQVTRNGGYVAFESMDGRNLYYSKSLWQSPLWRMPTSGGPETKILDRVGGLGFAVAPKGIYFMEQGTSNPRLELLNDSTGEVRALARIVRPTEDESDYGLSISPDERYAIFQRLDQAGSDLMLVDNFR